MLDDDWLSTTEVCRRLDLHLPTVHRLINSGQLVAYRFGRVIRVKETDLAAFIDACRIPPGSLSATTD